MHTGIKGEQVLPLIKFSAEEPRTSPRQPAMVQDCGTRVTYVTETFPICHSELCRDNIEVLWKAPQPEPHYNLVAYR